MDPILQIICLYLIILVIILFTLTIHELGHFAAAKAFKVHVKEFSIGIGPKIWWTRTKKNNTQISLRLFPIMAYVMMDSKALKEIYSDEQKNKNYSWYMQDPPEGKVLLENSKTYQYYIIMLAGVIINLLFFFIMWPICWAILNPIIVGGYPNPFIQLGSSFVAIWNNMTFNLEAASGSIFGEIIGTTESMDWWLVQMLNYLVMINLITAILNLVPLPPLDGYKVMSFSIVKTTKKKINENVELVLMIIGLLLLAYIFISSIIVDFIKPPAEEVQPAIQLFLHYFGS